MTQLELLPTEDTTARAPRAEHWMVAGGKIKMSPKLLTALFDRMPDEPRALLATARFNGTNMVVDDKAASTALMDWFAFGLPAIIDDLVTTLPRLAGTASNLLLAVTGDTEDRDQRKHDLAIGDADDSEWPQAKGLTKTDLRDPLTVLDILRRICRSDGMDWPVFLAEFGGMARTACAYGLPWSDWMDIEFATEVAAG